MVIPPKRRNTKIMSSKISHDSEVPKHGQQVITGCAFIHQKIDGVEKVFLPRRAKSKKFLPDVFELPGGHIDYGEEIVVGLKREIMEEFQMETSIGDLFYAFTYTNEIKGSHSAELIYFAKFNSPLENIKLNPEDHSEFRWIAESELDQIMTANKNGDDPEIQAIRKGFKLLNGTSLSFE
jgi:8-oxo-dGTP pyrophosphatase MutT (NUDIX family)